MLDAREFCPSIALLENGDARGRSQDHHIAHVVEQADLNDAGQRQQACFNRFRVGDGWTCMSVRNVVAVVRSKQFSVVLSHAHLATQNRFNLTFGGAVGEGRDFNGQWKGSLIYVMLGFGRLKLELLARLLLHSYYKTYIMIKFWDCPIWPGRSQSHNVFTST